MHFNYDDDNSDNDDDDDDDDNVFKKNCKIIIVEAPLER